MNIHDAKWLGQLGARNGVWRPEVFFNEANRLAYALAWEYKRRMMGCLV